MNRLYRKIALEMHPLLFMYNKAMRDNLNTDLRNAEFLRIKYAILDDEEFAYLEEEREEDDLIIKKKWRTMRDKYCGLQLKMINHEIDDEDLSLADRDFLATLSFLEPFVQHRRGQANVVVRAQHFDLDILEALEDYFGNNRRRINEVMARIRARNRQGNRLNAVHAPAGRGRRRVVRHFR